MRLFPVVLVAAIGLAFAACDDQSNVPTEPEAAVASFDDAVTGEDLWGTSATFPSTNEDNEAHVPQWGNVVYAGVEVGQVTLDFDSPRAFYTCFEYRADLEDAPTSDPNYNTEITDGLWTYTCPGGAAAGTDQRVLTANHFVDVRLSFGAEKDERFDWTRFYVLSPQNKDECKDGDWEAAGFKNLGQCVRFVETGEDSRLEE